jgi:hypothetical protein
MQWDKNNYIIMHSGAKSYNEESVRRFSCLNTSARVQQGIYYFEMLQKQMFLS